MINHNIAKSITGNNLFTLPVKDNLSYNVGSSYSFTRMSALRRELVFETHALDSHGLLTDRPAAKRDVLITIELTGPIILPDSILIKAVPFYKCGTSYKVTRYRPAIRTATVRSSDCLRCYAQGVTNLLRVVRPDIPLSSTGYSSILYGRDLLFTTTRVSFPLSIIASKFYLDDNGDFEGDTAVARYGRSDLVNGYWFRWTVASGSKILKRLSSLLICNNGTEE